MSSVSIEKTEHIKVGFVMNETAHSKAFYFGVPQASLNLSQDFWLNGKHKLTARKKHLLGKSRAGACTICTQLPGTSYEGSVLV